MTKTPNIFIEQELTPIFIRVFPQDIVVIKYLVESYEGVGIVRTLDKSSGNLVILCTKDTVEHVNKMLDDSASIVSFERLSSPPEINDDWLLS